MHAPIFHPDLGIELINTPLVGYIMKTTFLPNLDKLHSPYLSQIEINFPSVKVLGLHTNSAFVAIFFLLIPSLQSVLTAALSATFPKGSIGHITSTWLHEK